MELFEFIMKKIFIFFLLLPVLSYAQQLTDFSVYFDTDKFEITQEIRTKIDSVILTLPAPLSSLSGQLIGHTDSIGNKQYNIELSLNRSKAVAGYLILKGFLPDSIKLIAVDFSNPHAENKSLTGRQKNRRTEILIFRKEAIKPVVIKEPEIKSMNELYKYFSKEPEKFQLRGNRDTIISCKSGTKISIPAGSFSSKGKKPAETFELEVKEFYSYGDMLFNNLHTNSYNGILETGGMIYLNAMNGADTLQFDWNNNMAIGFPTVNKKTDMKIFYAEDSHGDSIGNWKPDRNFQFNNRHIGSRSYLKGKTEEIIIYQTKDDCYEMANGRIDTVLNCLTINSKGKVLNARTVKAQGKDKGYKIIFEGLKTRKYKRVYKDNTGKDSIGGSEEYKAYFWRSNRKYLRYNFNRRALGIRLRRRSNWEGSITKEEILGWYTNYGQKLENKTYYFWETESAKDSLFRQKCDSATLARIENQFISSTDTIKGISKKDLSFYMFKINKLGWINCDRFYENKSPKVNFVVKNQDNADIKIAFKNIKSVMNGREERGKTVFVNIPQNEIVTIVAIKMINNIPHLAIKETKISTAMINNLDYKPITLKDLKEKMNAL
jgi:hypothetical protein